MHSKGKERENDEGQNIVNTNNSPLTWFKSSACYFDTNFFVADCHIGQYKKAADKKICHCIFNYS